MPHDVSSEVDVKGRCNLPGWEGAESEHVIASKYGVQLTSSRDIHRLDPEHLSDFSMQKIVLHSCFPGTKNGNSIHNSVRTVLDSKLVRSIILI